MSWEVVSPNSKRRLAKADAEPTGSKSGFCGGNSRRRFIPQSNEEIRNFLAAYKIKPCENDDYHDTRLCLGYHSNVDDRRNP